MGNVYRRGRRAPRLGIAAKGCSTGTGEEVRGRQAAASPAGTTAFLAQVSKKRNIPVKKLNNYILVFLLYLHKLELKPCMAYSKHECC